MLKKKQVRMPMQRYLNMTTEQFEEWLLKKAIPQNSQKWFFEDEQTKEAVVEWWEKFKSSK